jgi:hypothetical protein
LSGGEYRIWGAAAERRRFAANTAVRAPAKSSNHAHLGPARPARPSPCEIFFLCGRHALLEREREGPRVWVSSLPLRLPRHEGLIGATCSHSVGVRVPARRRCVPANTQRVVALHALSMRGCLGAAYTTPGLSLLTVCSTPWISPLRGALGCALLLHKTERLALFVR